MRFIDKEFREGRKIRLDNVSYHPPELSFSFSHRSVEGDLALLRIGDRPVVKLGGRGFEVVEARDTLLVLPRAESLREHAILEEDKVLEYINHHAGEVSVINARHYVPGRGVSLYSGTWTFHCLLDGLKS